MSAAPSTGVAPGCGTAATAEPAGATIAGAAGCETEVRRVTILESCWELQTTTFWRCLGACLCCPRWPGAASARGPPDWQRRSLETPMLACDELKA